MRLIIFLNQSISVVHSEFPKFSVRKFMKLPPANIGNIQSTGTMTKPVSHDRLKPYYLNPQIQNAPTDSQINRDNFKPDQEYSQTRQVPHGGTTQELTVRILPIDPTHIPPQIVQTPLSINDSNSSPCTQPMNNSLPSSQVSSQRTEHMSQTPKSSQTNQSGHNSSNSY